MQFKSLLKDKRSKKARSKWRQKSKGSPVQTINDDADKVTLAMMGADMRSE